MMKPQFVNWPFGVLFADHSDTGHWWWPWVTPLFTWVEQVPPLIYDDGNGTWHRLTTPTGNTDFGSIPGCVQGIPGLNILRFVMPYTLHDDAYRQGLFNLSQNQGQTWFPVTVTERQANDRLRDMILVNPGDPGNRFEADTIWAGVEAGGWMSWKKGGWQAKLAFLRSRRALKASRKYNGHIDPLGGGGIILRMA